MRTFPYHSQFLDHTWTLVHTHDSHYKLLVSLFWFIFLLLHLQPLGEVVAQQVVQLDLLEQAIDVEFQLLVFPYSLNFGESYQKLLVYNLMWVLPLYCDPSQNLSLKVDHSH